MDDDRLNALRAALHKERDMPLVEQFLRPVDEEPVWLGSCLELIAEVDSLRAEVGALRRRPPMACVTCEGHNDQLVERIVRMCMTVCVECAAKAAFVDAQKWPLPETPWVSLPERPAANDE